LKVKKFRIKPRVSVVGRILKSLLGVKKLDPSLEESLPLEIQSVTSSLVPMAFYQTWARDEIPPFLQTLLSSYSFDKSIAISVVVATAGSQLEERISDCLLKGETTRSQVITAIGEEAADLTYNFISRLLIDDAKGDDCDISEPIFIKDSEALAELFRLLEAQAEGILVDSANHLSPRFTRVAILAWWPLSKKKRVISVPNKRVS
jgi:hypothetical protein